MSIKTAIDQFLVLMCKNGGVGGLEVVEVTMVVVVVVVVDSEREDTCDGVSHDRTCFRQSQWYGVVSRWSSEIDPVK